MQIFVHRDNQQLGPYTLDQVNCDLAAGRLNGSDLAWHDGIPNWIPLSQIPGVAAAPPPPPVVPAAFTPAASAVTGQRVQVRLSDGRTVDVDPAEFKKAKRKLAVKTMLYGALWFVGGLVVTGVSYAMASSSSGGGGYIVTWGAVIVGAIQMIKGLVRYIQA
jgi:hypothetical protein